MGVVVKFFATFRDITGHKQTEIPIKEPITLYKLLDRLIAMYGEEFRSNIMDKGKLRRFVNILVNGRAIRWLANLETPIHEGDTIAIFSPVGGGWMKDQL
ncbi:MAG: ubiquitin-like small modifier protein 1 [Candidatus Heimdallarchaeota archaeon]